MTMEAETDVKGNAASGTVVGRRNGNIQGKGGTKAAALMQRPPNLSFAVCQADRVNPGGALLVTGFEDLGGFACADTEPESRSRGD